MSKVTNVKDILDEGYNSIKLPMNVVVMFLHMHIHHKVVVPDECSINSCLVTPASPCCNHRETSPFRIKNLIFTQDKCDATTAHLLICKFVDDESGDQTIQGNSMMNFEDDLEGCNFVFNVVGDDEDDGTMESLFTLFFVSSTENNPCDHFDKLHDDYTLLVKQSGGDIVQLSQSVLRRFSQRFDDFHSLKCFQNLESVLDLCLNYWKQTKAITGEVDPIPNCVTDSSELFRIIFKFQGVVSLRFGFMEGAHRHLTYFNLLCNLELYSIGETEVSSSPYLIRRSTVDDDVTVCADLFLKYFTNVARPNVVPFLVSDTAVAVSKKSADTGKWSVFNEDVHE